MSESISVCGICKEAPYKYSCPRCNVLYCSINCYKSTSHLQCSEQFYKKCVEDELTANCSNFDPHKMNEGIRRMHEILQRVNEQDPSDYDFDMMESEFEKYMGDDGNDEIDEQEEILDSDDETDDDLTKRLEGINIDNADEVWNRLTNAEKYEFETLIETGEITKLLPPCKVWWEIQEDSKLIEDITCDQEENKQSKGIVFSYPEIMGDIQPFNTLTQKQPSSCVIHNITNILAAYAYMVRFFNGEHRQTPQEAVNCLVTLSATLKNNANYDNDELAIKSVIYEGQIEGLGPSDNELDIIRSDINKLYEGRFKGKTEKIYILSALSDIHRLLTVAKLTNSLNTKTKGENLNFHKKFPSSVKASLFNELDRRKLNNLIKKIEYYLSYINSK